MSKTFVIADIHGSYKGLLQCIKRSGFNNEEDTLICLGDVCLVPGTKITTLCGYKNIEDINIGDMVLTHKGNFKKVTNLFIRKIDEEINKITLKNKLEINLTKNHPVYSSNKFIKSEELATNNLLHSPIKFRNDLEKIDLFDFCKDFAIIENDRLYSNTDQIRSSHILRYFNLTDENLRLLGYFIGDGTCRHVKRRGTISFSYEDNDKKKCMETDIINFCFKNNIKFFKKQIGKCKTIHINSKILSSFFINFYNNKEKIIPKFLESLSSSQFLQLLYGLIITDGCIDNTRIRFNNTSKPLIDMIYFKSLEMGMMPTLCISRKQGINEFMNKTIYCKEYYEINYRNNSCKSLFDLFKINKVFGNNELGVTHEDYIEHKIKSIDTIQYSGNVYNLEVDSDNSYIANGVSVHNCDGYPESKECIDYLMTIKNFILLWGNHCYWFYEWLRYGYMPSIWTTQGGFATLKSFDYTVDDKYIEFFDKALPYYIDDKNNLYVHGGFNPYIELEENEFRVLIWDRDLIEYAKYLHETYLHETENPVRSINKFRNHIYRELSKYNNIFVGHTTTQRYESLVPVNFYNLWMLDTGAGWNEKLSIMDIDTKEYWQSDRSIDLYGKNQGR